MNISVFSLHYYFNINYTIILGGKSLHFGVSLLYIQYCLLAEDFFADLVLL